MSYYEHIFLARPDLTAQQLENLIKDFTGIIESNGGTAAKTENWGLRSLAYKIKKNRKAHYVLFNLDGPAAAVNELERQERINDNVLRFMTVRVDEFEEGPSIQMRVKASREERAGGRT